MVTNKSKFDLTEKLAYLSTTVLSLELETLPQTKDLKFRASD